MGEVWRKNDLINQYHFFQAAKVPVKEYEYDVKKLANVQSHLVCILISKLEVASIFFLKWGQIKMGCIHCCRKSWWATTIIWTSLLKMHIDRIFWHITHIPWRISLMFTDLTFRCDPCTVISAAFPLYIICLWLWHGDKYDYDIV